MLKPPFFITASAGAPPKREPWFSIKAEAGTADLKLRGYIGEASKGYDYWTGEEYETGGAGTLQEFEAALAALGEVDLINLYITSQGGDFPTAIAISSILARQKARIVCTIDGYAYSAAPVITCAADEVRSASNALVMIHDAEFWCAGADVETLRKHIETLDACNKAMAAAFINKAGGTEAEWMQRMTATTWLTGAQAKEIGLVDTLLDDVALSAYAPLKGITAALRAPDEIRALIDKAAPSTAPENPQTPTAMLRIRTPLMTAATEVPAAGGAPVAPVAPVVTTPEVVTTPQVTAAAAPLTLESIQTAITAAVQPMQATITALESKLKHIEGVNDQGIPQVTAAAPAPITGAAQKPDAEETPRLRAVTAFAKLPVFGGGK